MAEKEQVVLRTEYPLAGDSQEFILSLPRPLPEQAYQQIVTFIEFKRRCMNQGFDNLLELLAMQKPGIVEEESPAEASTLDFAR